MQNTDGITTKSQFHFLRLFMGNKKKNQKFEIHMAHGCGPSEAY